MLIARSVHPLPGEAERRERLLSLVSDVACQRLPATRPLWAARWVTGLPGASAACVLVVHHALADGMTAMRMASAILWDEVPVTGAPVTGPRITR